MRRLLFAVILLGASTALADPGASSGLRKRYDPGFSAGALTSVRGYEGLDGAAVAAGVDVGWAFDLVDFHLSVQQSLAAVVEHRPTYLGANLEYAFATVGGFSVLGTTGLDLVLDGPDRQTGHAGGDLFGPELGLGARYRVTPLVDVVATATVGLWLPTHGPRRMFVEPGLTGGLIFHPFASVN